MSTSDGFRRGLVAALATGVIALASCTLAPDHCLRMSDCGDGTTCVEGLCVGASPGPETLAAASVDASSATATDSSTSTSTTRDAAPADASDAGDASDGAMTDAPSDP